LTKTEQAYLSGSREFTKEQARVIRYRINKKIKASELKHTRNRLKLLEHYSAVWNLRAQYDDEEE
jgi:hypothetical protein